MRRRWALSPFAFARHHLLSEMVCRKNCTNEVTFHDVLADTVVVVVYGRLVLTDHIQTDEKRCRTCLTPHSPQFLAGSQRAMSRFSCVPHEFHRQRTYTQHLSSQSWYPRIDPSLVDHWLNTSCIQKRSSWLFHQGWKNPSKLLIEKAAQSAMSFGL